MNNNKKILITEFINQNSLKNLNKKFDVRYDENLCEKEREIIKIIKDYDGLIVRNKTQVNSDILKNAPNLKFIGVSRGGPVNIDLEACKKFGVTVSNAPGRNASAVAEFTVASILAETRLITKGHQSMIEGQWRGDLYRYDITGKELGEEETDS